MESLVAKTVSPRNADSSTSPKGENRFSDHASD